MALIDWRFACVRGVYGPLGGGKTLTAVSLIIDALLRGFPVSTNIKLRNVREDLLINYHYYENIFEEDYWKFPCGAPRGSGSDFRALVVLDEVAEAFDQYSGLKAKDFLSWLRHSSKCGQNVLLVVQQPEFMQKSLRLLVFQWIICSDMAQFRLPVLRIHPPFRDDYIGRRVFDRNGNLISRGYDFVSKTEFGQFYDTSQIISEDGKTISWEDKRAARPPRLIESQFVGVLFVILCVVNVFCICFFM